MFDQVNDSMSPLLPDKAGRLLTGFNSRYHTQTTVREQTVSVPVCSHVMTVRACSYPTAGMKFAIDESAASLEEVADSQPATDHADRGLHYTENKQSGVTMPQLPLVSIGMPVYNGSKLIRRALDSLLAQDYPNFELIISDNVSTDNTWDILQEYASRDARIKLYRNTLNKGMAYNFNRVYELATGDYFMWAAHDDWWEPIFISTCVQYLEANPDSIMCYAGPYPVSDEITALLASADPATRVRGIVRGTFAGTSPYGLVRREILGSALPLLNLEIPDGVVMLRLATRGPFIYLHMPMHHYHIGRRNIVIRLKSMGLKANVWNLLKWDVGFARAMVQAVWHIEVGFVQRLHMVGTVLLLTTKFWGWPYPMLFISRYVAVIIPVATFYPVIRWLHRHPRLLARLRRLTGMHLSLPPDA